MKRSIYLSLSILLGIIFATPLWFAYWLVDATGYGSPSPNAPYPWSAGVIVGWLSLTASAIWMRRRLEVSTHLFSTTGFMSPLVLYMMKFDDLAVPILLVFYPALLVVHLLVGSTILPLII